MNVQGAMGAVVELSSGAHFTARQMDQVKKMAKGAKFFISAVKAKGPDGITRDLPPMEVVLN
jgi:hypothetical protein